MDSIIFSGILILMSCIALIITLKALHYIYKVNTIMKITIAIFLIVFPVLSQDDSNITVIESRPLIFPMDKMTETLNTFSDSVGSTSSQILFLSESYWPTSLNETYNMLNNTTKVFNISTNFYITPTVTG